MPPYSFISMMRRFVKSSKDSDIIYTIRFDLEVKMSMEKERKGTQGEELISGMQRSFCTNAQL
jgi:hypothetical protein